MKFKIEIEVDDAFVSQRRIVVPDGTVVRAHDVAVVLDAHFAQVRQLGTSRINTVGEDEAIQKRLDLANAVLADWNATADGWNNANGAFSRNWEKNGRVVEAPCDANGDATLETADFLAALRPEPPTPEA